MADTKQEECKGEKEGGELMFAGYVIGSPFFVLGDKFEGSILGSLKRAHRVHPYFSAG